MQLSFVMKRIIDYVLIDSSSVQSYGLYDGMAGVSLALFEMANLYEDEYLEKCAVNLLEQSIASVDNNVTFGYGTSGVGWVLNYLIKSNLVDADFYELFLDKHETIIKEIGDRNKYDALDLVDVLYYFCFLPKNTLAGKWICLCQDVFDEGEQSLICLIDRAIKNDRLDVKSLISKIILFLKVSVNTMMFRPSVSFFDKFFDFYSSGRCVNNFEIGFYLHKMELDPSFNAVIMSNISVGFADLINRPRLSLSEKINLSWMLQENCFSFEKESLFLRDNLLNFSDDIASWESNIRLDIPYRSSISSCKDGLSKLLLYVSSFDTGRRLPF